MIEFAEKLDDKEKRLIHAEIAFLLHVHRKETPWDLIDNLRENSKDINPQT